MWQQHVTQAVLFGTHAKTVPLSKYGLVLIWKEAFWTEFEFILWRSPTLLSLGNCCHVAHAQLLRVTWIYPPLGRLCTHVELVTASPMPWASLLCDTGPQHCLDVFPLAGTPYCPIFSNLNATPTTLAVRYEIYGIYKYRVAINIGILLFTRVFKST